MKQKAKKLKGFTLIELLIVISIMVLLTVYGVGNFSNTTDELEFSAFVNELAGELRNIRAESLTGKSVPDYTDFDEDQIAHPLADGSCAEIIAKKGDAGITCSADETVVAAGIGMAFIEEQGVKKIYFFTDLHNDGEGSFDLSKSIAQNPQYLNEADIIEPAKTIDFSKDPYNKFDITLSKIGQPFSDKYLIYQPPFSDVILSSANAGELNIWVTRKVQGFITNNGVYGKIIRVGKVSGIPEVFEAKEIIK